MNEYRFKNINIRHDGADYLVNGIGFYIVEDYEEDGKEAAFESVKVFDALGKDGYVMSEETLAKIADAVCIDLNRDSHLCRVLGNKIIF